jgi:hypothetical protein
VQNSTSKVADNHSCEVPEVGVSFRDKVICEDIKRYLTTESDSEKIAPMTLEGTCREDQVLCLVLVILLQNQGKK